MSLVAFRVIRLAFTCLVSEYKEMIYAYAYHKLGDYLPGAEIQVMENLLPKSTASR